MPRITALNWALAGDLPHQNPYFARSAGSSSRNFRTGRNFAAAPAFSPTDDQTAYLEQERVRSAFASCARRLSAHRAKALSFVRANVQPRVKTAGSTAAHTIARILKNGSDDPGRVVNVRRIPASEPVYDLTVALGHLPEFFANGILTHNSSEGEIEVYDDTISAYQSRFEDPNLRRVINFEQLSLFGEIDSEITHRWNKLRPETQAELGQRLKDEADTMQKYVDLGAFSPGEVRKVAIENKDLPFTGLKAEDVPEPPAEEGLLGPGAGGAAKEFEAEHAEPGGGGGGEKKPPAATAKGDE